MAINDGGPAFPAVRTKQNRIDDIDVHSVGGMSLRDYFAAKAPIDFATVCAAWGDSNVSLVHDETRRAFIAVWALLRYEYADAMLAQRAEQEEGR